jgi:alcohol dehydrogenase class IV
MDVAKLAAALTTNPGAVAEFLGAGRVKVPSVPTVMVPTTAGTGSEATQVAMLAIDGKKAAVVSAPLMARAAVLDPDLTLGLPPAITAASGLDALSHAFESYLSTTANSSTRGASLHAATLIASAIRDAFDDGADRDARMSMLTGAYWSGIGLNASVVLGHSIAYTIANRTGLPHGVTCSMALPYCLAYNESASGGRIQELALALREQIGESARQRSDPTGIYGWLTELEHHLQVPASLADVGITPDDLSAMVDECIASYPRANNPVPFDAESLGRLYGFLFKGDIEGCAAAFSSR